MKHRISLKAEWLVQENLGEIEKRINELLKIDRAEDQDETGKEHYSRILEMAKASKAGFREIRVDGYWPNLVYHVSDYVTNPENERQLMLGYRKYRHSEIEV